MNINSTKGEFPIEIDGEIRAIKCTIEAQEGIVNDLELESIGDLPEALRSLQGRSLAVVVSHMLCEDATSVDELCKCSIPWLPASASITQAFSFAMYGKGGPPSNPPEAAAE